MFSPANRDTNPSFDPISFIKYMKNIGRAYRKQATELISVSRVFVQAQKQSSRLDIQLRKVLEVVDEALSCASGSKGKTSEKTDKKFQEAIKLLVDYETESSYPQTVAKRMEEAKSKDTSSSTILGQLQEKFRAKAHEDGAPGAPTVVEFLLQKSLPDRNPTIVRQVLCSKSDLQEILWNFSRLRGEGRLTLKQNPHFYKNLPASLEAYGCNFQTDPIENFLQARKIHVLTDKPGRVYLETPRHSRAFGNVWVPNDTIIFKDIYGKLEGESIVEASIDAILPNIWYREEPPLPIVNASSVNSIVGEALPVWKQLIRRSVDFQDINIHISTKPHELEDGWTSHSPTSSSASPLGCPSPLQHIDSSDGSTLSLALSPAELAKPSPSSSTAPQQHASVTEVLILQQTSTIMRGASSRLSETTASSAEVTNLPAQPIESSTDGHVPRQVAVSCTEQENSTGPLHTIPPSLHEDVPSRLNWFQRKVWDYRRGM